MLLLDTPASANAGTLFQDLTKLIWQAIAIGLAYGLISMALLQLFKDLYLRRAFNRREFNRWFPEKPEKRGKAPTSRPAGARKDLLSLAAAGDEDALFGLPIEKLAGQINVAANAVIESPAEHAQLLKLLAIEADPQDVTRLVDTAPELLRQKENISEDEKLLRFLYADARTRIGHRIQRTIDKLQLSASQRWTRLNRWLAMLLAFLLGLTPVFLRSLLERRYGFIAMSSLLPYSVCLSIIGGCLAPLLRDLMSSQPRSE